MKKGFISRLILCASIQFLAFSANLPEQIMGNWDGKDRIITFTQEQNTENPVLIMSLKTYYGLYNDRVAEPESAAEKNPRTRNTATHIDSEKIPFETEPLYVNGKAVDNAWVLKMNYSKHDVKYVPFILMGDEIYFEFYVQVNNHCYAQFGSSDGIKLSKTDDKDNIACLVFVNGIDVGPEYEGKTQVFDVRYWKSQMDYSDENAYFTWNEREYFVPKHILSGVQNYSCTSGRSNRIRNAQKPVHNYDDFEFLQDGQMVVKKGTAGLVRVN